MINLQKLADYLGLTLDNFGESGITEDDVQENRGSSGEVYCSYFLVTPGGANFGILKETSIPLKPGELSNISRWELEAEAE